MNAQGGLQSADAVLHRAAERLAQQFTGMVGEETVERVVFESYTTLGGRTATVTSLLPTLAEKFVHDRLVALAQSRGQVAKTVPEILYVCVQNSGRSQMAAAITRQLAGDRVHIRSAGSQPAADLLPGVVTVLTEAGGIDLTGEFPKPLTDDVVRAADAVVTMGCGDACPLYPGKRYLDCISPTGRLDLDGIRTVRDEIQEHVEQLLTELLPSTGTAS